MLSFLSSLTLNVSNLILIIPQIGLLQIWFAQDYLLVERILVREIQVILCFAPKTLKVVAALSLIQYFFSKGHTKETLIFDVIKKS